MLPTDGVGAELMSKLPIASTLTVALVALAFCSGAAAAEPRLLEPERVRPWPLGTGLAVADWMRGRGLAVEFAPLPVWG